MAAQAHFEAEAEAAGAAAEPQWDDELMYMLERASPQDTAWRARLRDTSDEALKGARDPMNGDSYAHWATWNQKTTAPLKEIVRRWPEAAWAKTNTDWTPLHSAARDGCLANVRVLVEEGAGADLGAVEKNGDTALEHARGNG